MTRHVDRDIKLASMVKQWKEHAGRYFTLAEQENDPLGQKFYQSSAMVYANCAAEVIRLIGVNSNHAHTPQ